MALPSYAELPVVEGAPPGSSWGVWGPEDRLGALNLLTPERVAAGVRAIRDHRVISLNLPLSLPDPPLFGRRPYQHEVTVVTVGHDEYLSGWFPQGSSQWDGFRHVSFPGHGFYNGLPDESHGMEHWSERGIVGRAVLVDVGRWRSRAGWPVDFEDADPITVDDLAQTLADQGTSVEPGDVLVIRTGWTEWYRALPDAGRAELAAAGVYAFKSPGLQPGKDMAGYLWDLHIAAAATDSPALERWPRGWPITEEEARLRFKDPERCEEVSLHFSLLPLLGIPIGELWDLDELGAACAADGRYEFLLSSAPLSLPGGVGSSANAVAIR